MVITWWTCFWYMTPKGHSGRNVKTLENAFRIFELLTDEDALTLAEMATALDVPKSTLHRYLKTLEYNGYLKRDRDRYRLGFRFLEFGLLTRVRSPIWNAGKDRADHLSEALGERVWLVANEGDFTYHIYLSKADLSITTPSNVGVQRLLHQTATGRAVLAHLPDEEIQAFVDRRGLPALTQGTIVDRDRLFEEIERIREVGYSRANGEVVDGVSAVTTAVVDSDGHPVGGVSIAGPTYRFTDKYVTGTLVDPLLETANEIQVDMRTIE